MGMYDTVRIHCPACIIGHIDAQTKSGSCSLNEYDLDEAPAQVLVGLTNQVFICPKCGTALEVKLRTSAYVRRAKVPEKYDGVAED